MWLVVKIAEDCRRLERSGSPLRVSTRDIFRSLGPTILYAHVPSAWWDVGWGLNWKIWHERIGGKYGLKMYDEHGYCFQRYVFIDRSTLRMVGDIKTSFRIVLVDVNLGSLLLNNELNRLEPIYTYSLMRNHIY